MDDLKTALTFDLDTLILPISEVEPVGCDLRKDTSPTSLYYQVKDARSAARTIERQAMQGSANENASDDWRKVCQLAFEILSTKSKDIEICAWYVEGLLRLHGFAGLRDGFRLAKALIDQYGEALYPTISDEGLSAKLSAFKGLNGVDVEGTLIVPIGSVYITQGESKGPYAFWHFQLACNVENVTDPEVRAQKIAAGAVTMNDFKTAVKETPAQFYINLHADIKSAIDEFTQLTTMLDALCNGDAPPSSNINNALMKVLDSVEMFGKDHLAVLPSSNSPEQSTSTFSSSNLSQPIANRDVALKMLLNVADFFHSTEPHSPLPYILQRAVRWGKMNLPDLLAELIVEEGARKEVFRLTGMETSSVEVPD